MARLKRAFKNRKPIRTGSLIVTMFGDSVAPRGGSIWLGSLIDACGLLDIQHRLVRTAVYRLVQDGVLNNQSQGRRSFYALTPAGKREFDEATQRIYYESPDRWDGAWCLVLTTNLSTGQRAAVRKRLAWQGFGSFGVDLLAHPCADRDSVTAALNAAQAGDRAVVMTAATPPGQSDEGLEGLLASAWDLAALDEAYTGYVAVFAPFLGALQAGEAVSDEDAFLLRTFMIHEYRKVLLRDPALPAELLPPAWPGIAAYQLSQALYRLVTVQAERYIDRHFENQHGPLPRAGAIFHERFGGLQV